MALIAAADQDKPRLQPGCRAMRQCTADPLLRESIDIIKYQTEVTRAIVVNQKACIQALRGGGDWQSPCGAATSTFLHEVVLKDMGIYLDTIGEAAVARQDARLLEVGNDFSFYTEQARTLDEEISLRMTKEQLAELLGM